ncbi:MULTISPECIES: hypothetical protein [unclassified Modestobacter]
MGLITRLAVRRAAALVVEVPGWSTSRCAVERELRARGWRMAVSPADADALVLCGRPGARLAAAVDHAWTQLPGPRARVSVASPDGAAAALDRVAADLADDAAQRRDAADRPGEPPQGAGATDAVDDDHRDDGGEDDDTVHGHADDDETGEPPAFDDPGPQDDGDDDPGADSDFHPGDHGDMDHGDSDSHPGDHGQMDHGDSGVGDMDHGDMDHGGMDHGGMDHGGMDHGGMDHGGMDHGGMDMPMPGGIMLAGSGDEDQLPDPDGLDLDVLHVPLGPVLAHWPVGLLLHTTLQGELIVGARAEVLEPGAPPPGDDLHGSPAGRWDAVATLLALAGWADAAATAARLRDAALAGALPQADAERLARRVRRSRLLRAALRGLGRLPEGDAHDRLLHWLDGHAPQRAITTDEVADLVTGLDLASARLVVASLDLDTTDRHRVPVESAS